ncbi:MAG: hypothetical protein FWE09_07240, partial [Treponema sp.]|nr:hypothetical protein [Treponema sp.]
MKKNIIFYAVFVVAFIVAPAALSAMPDRIRDALHAAQDRGSMTGVGVSVLQNTTQARNAAIISARAELARGIEVFIYSEQISIMETLAINRSEATDTFFADVIRSLAERSLVGSRVVFDQRDVATGEYWALVEVPASVASAAIPAAIETAATAAQSSS